MSELIVVKRKKDAKPRGDGLIVSSHEFLPNFADLVPDGEGAARCRELYGEYAHADDYEFHIVKAGEFEVVV